MMAQVHHVSVCGAPPTPEGAVKILICGSQVLHLGVLGNIPLVSGEAFDRWFDP
jgi:hypothetical protein